MEEPHAVSPLFSVPVSGILRWCARVLAVVMFGTGLAYAAEGEEAPTKRVLLISTGSRLAPGFILVDQQIFQALTATPSLRIETYAENIDIVRFPEERSQRIFGEYLAAKYSDYPPDLVILVYVGNLGITGQILTQLFPDTPIVVAGYTEEEFRPDQFGRLVSGFAQRVDPAATLELMLRLQPGLRRIVVIGGIADVDAQILRRVEQAAQTFKDRVEFEFWRDRSIADVRGAVTALPADTAILFTRMFRDGAGQALVSADVGRWIGQFANAPVYLLFDTILGTGAVGGAVASAEAFGRRAGELARQILTGASPASLPFEVLSDTMPMFDWRALQRWRISEALLPSNSVVRFKPPSIWAQYRAYIIAALLIMLVQSATIGALALQRRQRRRIEASLQESRQLMELATEAGELGLWSRNLAAGTVWANPTMRAMLGFGPEPELRFTDVIERVHPEDRARVTAAIERAQADDTTFEAEYRVRTPEGVERWVFTRGRTMTDVRGDGTRRMGVVWDITERKHSEQALRESEERFRTVANAAPVMIWMSGPDQLCTFVNLRWLDFTGHTLDQALGDGWAEGIHSDDRVKALHTYETAFDARREFTMEYRLRRCDGEYRNILDNGAPRFTSDGTFLGYIGTCFDVTEIKRAQDSVHEQRTFLRRVIDINPNFIFAKDREGRFTLANKAVADAYGVEPEDLIGKTDSDFNTHPQEVEFFRRMDAEVMRTLKERFIPEERITDAQGNVRWLQTVKCPIIGSDGVANQVLGASTDITQRKITELELQKQRAELAHVARVALMGQLSASLAHELNQPLTAILTNAQAGLRFMMQDPPNLGELRPIFEDIVAANARAAEIIRNMRVFLKKEEQPQFTTLDVANVICDVVVLLHSDAMMHDVRIALDLDANLPRVRGDRVQLQQVVMNILLNAFDAVKACPPDRRAVTIAARRQGNANIRIGVTDRGPGLSTEALEKAFQPFYTTKREGLGMGLSICSTIVEAHGGALGAENHGEGGATFYVTLPADTRAVVVNW